jgi:thiosulfate/3-mercaptopyruvate sulfurtransferase
MKKKNGKSIIGLVIGLLLLQGIATTMFAQKGENLRSAKRVRAEMLVSTDWLAKNLEKAVVLQIAQKRETYDAGHIPNARFIAWSELTATRDGVPNELPTVADLQKLFERLGIGETGRIVIYGDNFGLFAARAFFTLDYLGHGNRVALLDGGLEKWKNEKRPVSTAETKFQPQTFTPRVKPEAVLGLDVMRDLSWIAVNTAQPGVALIDARPPEEYTGAKAGDGISRPGHIPGAANVFWMQNIESRENPVMRQADELRKLYEAAGVNASRKIITYCRTGGQASHAYFTLKYLGYDPAMYDGSFFEWSSAKDTPVIAAQPKN